MNVIALVRTRSERWVIAHALDGLSARGEVTLVSDRNSDDGTREICRRFPQAVVFDPAPDSRIRELRCQLLDAARHVGRRGVKAARRRLPV